MPVQASSKSTRVPDQISDLATNLAAIDVSQERGQHTSLVFGDFSGTTEGSNSGEPHTLETLTAQVHVNYDKAQLEVNNLKQTLSGIRQDTAEQQAEQQTFKRDLMTAVTELKQSVAALRTAKDGRPPGPTDSDGVAKALRDSAARQEATKIFGIRWLIETKEKDLWPADALKDDEFMFQYYQLKHCGTAGPSDPPLPSASANADLLASVPRPASVLGKAALIHYLALCLPLLQLALPFLSQLQLLASMSRLTSQSQASCLALQ